MKGDSVDNIPGLPGVGDKTAKKFLKQYGSLEDLLENTSELKGKLKEKIEQNKELGILSKKLATIITDVPINYKIEELKFNVTNLDKTREIFDELEFKRLSSSLSSIFLKNDNDKVEKDEKKSELENNISSNPGFGQFNLFENVNRPSKKEKLNVVYQYIES